MSAKMSAARRAAFLKALSETGNITVSAERAKVSRSWVQLHRSSDDSFDSACRAAVEEAKAALRQAQGERGSNRPLPGWGFAGGEELVVKGTRSGTGRRVQVARARIKQWTPRVERRFLAMLLATANVTASCKAVGMTPASAFGHRARWPLFAELWDEAVKEGAMRIEAGAVLAGCNLFSDDELPPDVPIVEMSAAQAIHILHMTKNKRHGTGKAPGKSWRSPEPWPILERRLIDTIRARLGAFEVAERVPGLRGARRGRRG